MHLLHALPGALFRRPPLPAYDPGAAQAGAARGALVSVHAEHNRAGPKPVAGASRSQEARRAKTFSLRSLGLTARLATIAPQTKIGGTGPAPRLRHSERR